MKPKKTILFVRDLKQFSGGHLKLFDYINHCKSLEFLKPILHITPTSDLELSRKLTPQGIETVSDLIEADIYFVAGHDWGILDSSGIETVGKPVVNLIQGMRHSFPDNPLHQFLSRPAMRICVSSQVATALSRIQETQGPIVTIPNGLTLNSQKTEKQKRVFIGGMKDRDLAEKLASVLRNDHIEVDLCINHLSRVDYLARIDFSEIAVLLPLPAEGFFLPALEAMKLGSVVIVPDCVGARSFCLDDETCLVPARTIGALHAAVRALWDNHKLKSSLKNAAFKISAAYTLERERDKFCYALQSYLETFS